MWFTWLVPILQDDPDNPLSSVNIENYYLRDSKAVLNTSSGSCRSKIDFSGLYIFMLTVVVGLENEKLSCIDLQLSAYVVMLQTDLTTGRQRRIQRSLNIDRSCSCFIAAPVFWERVDPTLPYQLIPLSEVSPEYQTVANYVKHDGLLNRSIVSISRIQNLDLWEIYCRKKKQLLRIQHVTEIQERRLFHGTNSKNVDSICKYNFDLRLAGQNGHVFGRGIYFASHATYADKYSTKSLDSLPLYGQEKDGGLTEYSKIMFLARVMVGKSNTGESHFKTPDDGNLKSSYDSCVDDTTHPKIFVIFDPNQIYPEYLVQYK